MAEIGYSITVKLIEVLAHEAILNICRLWNYDSQLEKLKQTVSMIQKVFLDADAKWDHLNNQDRDFIRKLKDAVYDAEDVFDEFHTRAELDQLGKKSKVRKFFGKVRAIFSSDKNQNQVIHAYRVSRDVMDIMKRLDAIAAEHNKFNLQVDNNPIVRRREETISYVDAHRIFGRDKDKEKIISVLLDPNVQDNFCFLSIVGVGGLGKTTLAQLVINDEKIQKEFPNPTYRLWVCVSDQDGEKFDEKTILGKILELLTRNKPDNSSSKEFVHKQFRHEIRGKKYVLVLDDVWNEDREKWLCLEDFLRMGHGGSKIIVTTRSQQTASIIGSEHVYKLDGLSQEDSKYLFEMSAFGDREKNNQFFEIGEKIVRKCHRNPLALKVIGSLLYGQDLSKWESIEKSGLADIREGSDKILPILKLSYYSLEPLLKSCFSYCAIFPKDLEMDKEMLIGLWMAQGYIVEDVAEEYFMILMRRCFFQDIEKDKYDNVVSVKIHDLMHDVAQEVGKEEICVVTSRVSNLGEKVRHVNFIGDGIANISLCSSKVRSYICDDRVKNLWDKQIENLIALRVLDLSYLDIKILPQSIDRLLLLRYLNLSNNDSLEVLPDSITRLYNLQTLVLCDCKNLREVPKDFCYLKNLRLLDLYGCPNLNEMPLGILKLTKLRVLPYFVARNEISDEDLKILQQVFTKIKGAICIDNVNEVTDTMKPLARLEIDFGYKGEWVIHESVLEKLKLPLNLFRLNFWGYKGKTIPWKTDYLPHSLLCIVFSYCHHLEQIPVLSRLPNLKSLEFSMLDSLEYMENGKSSSNETEVIAEFFPSLESLEIKGMEKLKGWWKGVFPGMSLRFPHLSHLKITYCRNLGLNFLCPPTLEKLELYGNSESLVIAGESGKLKRMIIDKVDHLKLLSPSNCCLTSLTIRGEIEVESALELAQNCASSLRTLTFVDCKNLRRLSRLDHLTALETLLLEWNDELSICEEDDEEAWRLMPQSLRQLKFAYIPNMKSLPKGMQHLASLQSLHLHHCENIEGGLPEWMSCLSSLQSLKIRHCKGIKSLPEAFKDLTSLKKLDISDCPDLEQRCNKVNGEDLPKIQHISNIWMGEEFYWN